MLPETADDDLAVLAGRQLYRIAATRDGLSVRADEINPKTCRVELSETPRRWTFQLPDDGFRFEVDDPDDSPLMSPTQLFARSLADQLGHADARV